MPRVAIRRVQAMAMSLGCFVVEGRARSGRMIELLMAAHGVAGAKVFADGLLATLRVYASIFQSQSRLLSFRRYAYRVQEESASTVGARARCRPMCRVGKAMAACASTTMMTRRCDLCRGTMITG